MDQAANEPFTLAVQPEGIRPILQLVVPTSESTQVSSIEFENQAVRRNSIRSNCGVEWIKGDVLGSGSKGDVYLGMDASNGLLMAVKQIQLPTRSAPNEAKNKSILSVLEREIELLQDLQHGNIVRYLNSSINGDHFHLFLEYLPGGSVSNLLLKYGAFEECLVKSFLCQILQALNYLHDRHIVHCDLKGSHLLVGNSGEVKISGFSHAKRLDDQSASTAQQSILGSVFWIAPEVLKQSGHTHKADVWSVGCCVVEMLTAEHPWAQLGQTEVLLKLASMEKPSVPSNISSEAQDFLARTFEIDHVSRPSASDLLQHGWLA